MQEGEAVEKGALLYTLDVDTATKDGGVQQQIINTQTAERQMLTQEIDRKTRMSEETKEELQHKIENLKVADKPGRWTDYVSASLRKKS